MMEYATKITALYSRLSVGDEDRDGGESNSIVNQKVFLERYARGHNPNAHSEKELALIRRILKRNGVYGLAEVYLQSRKCGYTRGFASMCRQIT